MTAYKPRRATATQVVYPWRASARTGLAALIAAVLVGGVVWALYAGLDVETSVEAIVSSIVVVAGAITRVMVHPAVNTALEHLGLGPTPKDEL